MDHPNNLLSGALRRLRHFCVAADRLSLSVFSLFSVLLVRVHPRRSRECSLDRTFLFEFRGAHDQEVLRKQIVLLSSHLNGRPKFARGCGNPAENETRAAGCRGFKESPSETEAKTSNQRGEGDVHTLVLRCLLSGNFRRLFESGQPEFFRSNTPFEARSDPSHHTRPVRERHR